MKYTALCIVGSLIMVLTSSCGSGGHTAPTVAPLPSSTAQAATPLISSASPIPAPAGPFPIGDYKALGTAPYADEVKFLGDGTYGIHHVTGSWAMGTYIVSGDQIILNDTSGDCLNLPATLTWAVHGNVLTFQYVAEKCPASARTRELAHYPAQWARQP